MGERKVLNKYYPPDFDPAKIPRRRQLKNQQMKVRMMLPMSIRCGTCGTYIYKGTKFNSRKEDVIGETYLGIPIFRFYIKCTRCSAEITFKTDPQNSDYTVESGASRNFEPWRDEEEVVDKEKRKRAEEEMGDAMKSLENRAIDSKQDMDILAALEEMRSMKSRHATVSVDLMLETLKRSAYEKEKKIMEELDEADEALIKSITFHGSKDFVRRIDEEEDEDDIEELGKASSSLSESSKGKITLEPLAKMEKATDSLTKSTVADYARDGGGSVKRKFIVKPRSTLEVTKKPQIASEDSDPSNNHGDGGEKHDTRGTQSTNGLQSLFQNYGSDDSD
ncbi:splicing factor YJU2-like [Zingiber officinale]|uniref:splicing factor YJU2-like n=1 Tax=Zingiber officinale TaxID=94328 RepID=UPI001C4A94E8|nr:splicing factor YJU2-like [Zingiber officinale]